MGAEVYWRSWGKGCGGEGEGSFSGLCVAVASTN